MDATQRRLVASDGALNVMLPGDLSADQLAEFNTGTQAMRTVDDLLAALLRFNREWDSGVVIVEDD